MSGARANVGSDGLNPNRQRGFGLKRIETPTLNDMRARQGAVVSKFMNFMQRKNTVVIELYEKAFYTRRPTWESLANFVYSDLCPSDELRSGVVDVQLHPVKMMLFIKFKTENSRDEVVTRLQATNGLMWTEYGVKVRGHSLDGTVRIITVYGASPETTEQEVKAAFVETGIGEVIEASRGLLDPKRLPGVTNGKWKVKVKIDNPDMKIPSYIIRKEEGELWSLSFDGRRFVCWKCGSPDHIGDKCRAQEKTFEEVFGESDSDEAAPASWAAVVKGRTGTGPDLSAKRDSFAKQIRENNERKARERKEAEEKRQAEIAEQERAEKAAAEERRLVLIAEQERVRHKINEASKVKDNNTELNDSTGVDWNNSVEKNLLEIFGSGGEGQHSEEGEDKLKSLSGGQGVGNQGEREAEQQENHNLVPGGQGGDQQGVCRNNQQGQDNVLPVGQEDVHQAEEEREQKQNNRLLGRLGNDVQVGEKEEQQGHQEHGEGDQVDRALCDESSSSGIFQCNSSLEKVFGTGATKLAIELEERTEKERGLKSSFSDSGSGSDIELTVSTPAKDQRKKRERNNIKFGDISGIFGLIAQHDISSEGEPSGGTNKEVKKPRLEESMETEEYVEGKEEESEFKENEEFQLGVRGPISDKGGGGSPERDH